MTRTIIGAVILGATVAGIAVFLLCADVILGLRHRGEAADAPAKPTPTYPRCARPTPGADPVDDHYATAWPLEYVPNRPDPQLADFERDMAATTAARLAIHLTYRSPR